MNSRNAIQNELREMNSSLPYNVKEPVFNVPEFYFDNFASSVLARIKGEQAVTAAEELQQLSPVLAAIPKKMPYETPENYFTGIADELPMLMKPEVLSPVLAQHDKKMPYKVPDGYFDSLPATIKARINKPKAKVIALNSRRWLRMAAAAMIIGIIVIGGILYFRGQETIDPNEHPQAWIARELKEVSKKDLDEFIKTVGINTSRDMAQKGNLHSDSEVRKLLQDVSATEIGAFLNTIPTDDEDLSELN
ncbi:MAG: hypothetical protein ICV51_08880 [Flavisolibacter sp.]|nr:hypothetical protein [Flavisolibacter sp.]